jgi:hypothetical protein
MWTSRKTRERRLGAVEASIQSVFEMEAEQRTYLMSRDIVLASALATVLALDDDTVERLHDALIRGNPRFTWSNDADSDH